MKMEGRIHELETDLDNEVRKTADAVKLTRKAERRFKVLFEEILIAILYYYFRTSPINPRKTRKTLFDYKIYPINLTQK